MYSKEQFENKVINETTLNYGSEWMEKQPLFDISPIEFIRFSEEDLNENTKKSLINALSNLKRSLDSQIEIIIHEHGYLKKAKKERWNFPKKIKFLKEKNIFAPRILEKINNLRNRLEHDFKMPDKEKVEDAIDMATLFLVYLKRVKRVPDRIRLGLDESSSQYVNIDFVKENTLFKVSFDSQELFSISETDKSFNRLCQIFYGTQPATWSLVSRNDLQDNNY